VKTSAEIEKIRLENTDWKKENKNVMENQDSEVTCRLSEESKDLGSS
jgi:urease accessory protein UreE